MPIHDWTRVKPGIFHHFHLEWISSLATAFNSGLLPSTLYALAEQVTGDGGIPDILTLATAPPKRPEYPALHDELPTIGGVALATAPPKVQFSAEAEADLLSTRQRRIAIRHTSGDHVVAVVEIVSPGNKASRYAMERFAEKTADLLTASIHLLILDLFPPSERDPEGIHPLIWSRFGQNEFPIAEDRNLTLAAYAARERKLAFVEHTSVGTELIEMPLFFCPERYINVPLEETYLRAFAAVPERWRKELEPQGER